MDYDGIKMNELEESIANNECTRNGTVIFDSQKNILEILEKQTGTHSKYKNKRKLKGKLKGTNKGRKRMKHIPEFCPSYPDNLLYQHTPIYYKGISHHQNEGEDDEKIKDMINNHEDNKEKTR